MNRCAIPILTLLVLSLLSCRVQTERPQNILLVSIDTLRADRIGCYGHENAGTPTLDGLAARGVRFADAMAPSPTTAATHASLLSGLDPLRHRVRHNGLFALPAEVATVTERLAEAGFRTGGFVGSIVLAKRYGLAQGFESYTWPEPRTDPELFYVGERAATEVNRDALGWLDTVGEAPFFLFVHYMEPHAPYRPPEPERARFPQDRYQGEIAAADRALGELLSAVEQRGRLQDKLVVVVADHGESLGEHGELTHGIFLYQSTLHVPLIAAGPGVRPATVVEIPVSLVDVTPSLLEATGLESDSTLDGQSLWPAMAGRTQTARELYAETFVPRYDHGWSELRALRRGAMKYVQAPRAELYALDRDPDEAQDLLETRPEEAQVMAGDLAALVERLEAADREPQRLQITQQEREALEALGYLAGGHGDAAGGLLPDPKDVIGENSPLSEAEELARLGRDDEAVRLLRRLVADNPANHSARIRLLLTLILSGKTEEAITEGNALVEAAGNAPDGEKLAARAHLFLAQLYLDQQRLEDAVREYELALAAPQPVRIYDMLAALYHDMGRDEQAIRVLREVIDRGLATERSREMLRVLELPAAGNR
jgi:arylsulfatase A-like enzyme